MIRRLKIPSLVKAFLPRLAPLSSLAPIRLNQPSYSNNLTGFKNLFSMSTFPHKNMLKSNY